MVPYPLAKAAWYGEKKSPFVIFFSKPGKALVRGKIFRRS
jgi:hypothetical protein